MSRRILGLASALVSTLCVVAFIQASYTQRRVREANQRLENLFPDEWGPLRPKRPPAILGLLREGADIGMRSRWGADLLMVAAIRGEVDACRHLIQRGFKVNAVDDNQQTPLHYASVSGSPECVELLLAHGANVDAEAQNGGTALIDAAGQEDLATTALLLANGADPNHRTKRGSTPLMSSAHGYFRESEAVKVAKLLLEHGADPNLKDRDGECALNLAVNSRFPEMVKLLKSAGARR